ncbi:hypothetical protein SAMN03159382_01277 [Pseudomonas sp. NFACC23-1]|nr:hypothetical protein SAMN03159386_00967 [Pseudomonas sp. NFACC17-2]SEJ13358.1 hypothetical protein SAMN03159382_01277 [Pseudomonas sp. NFACC23-1]SFW46729.1 hypothetical protein SAMN05660640_01537 [Pseudomonas sp. NFACC16-2]
MRIRSLPWNYPCIPCGSEQGRQSQAGCQGATLSSRERSNG